jgi:hypothetical protein
MPFHRAAAVKSLVNGQLDSLRALIFRPEIYTWWENPNPSPNPDPNPNP